MRPDHELFASGLGAAAAEARMRASSKQLSSFAAKALAALALDLEGAVRRYVAGNDPDLELRQDLVRAAQRADRAQLEAALAVLREKKRG